MGLYDREYYREGQGRREFWQIGPVTLTLIGVTVALFFVQLATLNVRKDDIGFDPLLTWGGFSDKKILDGEIWRLFTSLFLHDPYQGMWLLVAGLFVLAYCGRSIEGTYGPKEMFWYYVVTGLFTQLALFAVCIARPFDFVPPEPGYGCGGPVAAVMVLFAVMAPNAPVPLLFTSIRAGTLATIVILANLLLFIASRSHYFSAIPVLAGAAFAFAYHQYHWRVSNWIPDLPGLRSNRLPRPVKSRPLFQNSPEEITPPHIPREKPENSRIALDSEPETVRAPRDEQLEAQVDRVLAKVSKFGKDSLTQDEQAVLQRASEVYKNRRK